MGLDNAGHASCAHRSRNDEAEHSINFLSIACARSTPNGPRLPAEYDESRSSFYLAMISATCFRSKDNFLLHAMEYDGPPRMSLYVFAFIVVVFIYCEAFANWMHTQGSLGMLLVGGCCILCSFPPVPGFSLAVILSGFTLGWLPVALGTFVGGINDICAVAVARCYKPKQSNNVRQYLIPHGTSNSYGTMLKGNEHAWQLQHVLT